MLSHCIQADGAVPISFVTCLSNREVFDSNLLASPTMASGTVHELIAVANCPSAADGLDVGLKRAKHEWVVWVHEDVLLPEGWDQCLANQLSEAERQFGSIGVAGVYGVGDILAPHDRAQPLAAERIGWVIDRGRVLLDGPELPARVASLDELLLIVKRDSGLRIDPALGFHLYGADICLQAREPGPAVAALGALCHHNSRSIGLPEAFFRSAEVFARKWSHRLPVATPCVIIDRGGAVHVLGNAEPGPQSIAYALSSQGQDQVGTRISRNFGGVLSAGCFDR
jgi:Glycosyltransferase like family